MEAEKIRNDLLLRSKPFGLIPTFSIAQFEIGTMKNFVYLIIDWNEKVAACVDPQTDLHPIKSTLAENGLTLSQILLTHTHFDHVAGVPLLLKENPKLPVFLNVADYDRIEKVCPKQNAHFIEDQEELKLGSLMIQCLHTPGHSPGEICYLVYRNKKEENPSWLLTGDTLFIRDCGRTDLKGGSNQDMFDSLQKIKSLPGDPLVLPGHHYQAEVCSTLEQEKKRNPALQVLSVQDLSELP